MNAAVTSRHRDLAWLAVNFGEPATSFQSRSWIEQGVDGGPPLFEQEQRVARALADIEASAFAAAPLAPTGGGELEHLEALAESLERVTRYSGCGDNSCMFQKPSGMATNGGCRCLPHGKPFLAASLSSLARCARELLDAERARKASK